MMLAVGSSAGASSPLPSDAYIKYLPHIVTGGGFVTKITITNLGGSDNQVTVNIIGQDGTLRSSTQYKLAPLATTRITTSTAARFGPTDVTWAAIASQQPIGVNLFFELASDPASQTVISTLGFNDVPAQSSFKIPIEMQPATATSPIGRTLGIAMANPNGTAATANLQLVDSTGLQVATTKISIPAYGQNGADLAKVLTLPSSDFVGVLNVTSDQPVSAIGVGDDLGPLYSQPPVGPVAGTLVLPHIVTGGGFVTKITAVNFSSVPAVATLTLYNQAGTAVGSVPLTIPGNGAARYATAESARFGDTVVNWATIGTAVPIGVNEFFELQTAPGAAIGSAAGFNDSPPGTQFFIPAELEPGKAGSIGRTVGLALANPNDTSVNTTVRLLDGSGAQIGIYTFSMPPKSQTGFDLQKTPQFSAALPPGNFVGTLNISASGLVSPIGVGDNLGPLFSTPPVGQFTLTGVSSGTVAPFQHVTLTGSGFDPATSAIAVMVIPRTAGLATRVVAAYTATPGSVDLVVPPITDANGNFVSTIADLQVVQASGTSLTSSNVLSSALNIAAVPAAPPTTTGAVSKAFYSIVLNLLNNAKSAMQSAGASPDLLTAVGNAITTTTTLQTDIAILISNPNSPLTLGTTTTGLNLTFDSNALKALDRLLIAYMQQFQAAAPKPEPQPGPTVSATVTCPATVGDAATDALLCNQQQIYATAQPNTNSSTGLGQLHSAYAQGAWSMSQDGNMPLQLMTEGLLSTSLWHIVVGTPAVDPGIDSLAATGASALTTTAQYGQPVTQFLNTAFQSFQSIAGTSKALNAFTPHGGSMGPAPPVFDPTGGHAGFVYTKGALSTAAGTLVGVAAAQKFGSLVAATLPLPPLSAYNGSYTGSYSGTFDDGTPDSGSVSLTVSNGVISVSSPVIGTGSIDATGKVLVGNGTTAGATCTFSGRFNAGATGASGGGNYTCNTFYGTETGNWTVNKN